MGLIEVTLDTTAIAARIARVDIGIQRIPEIGLELIEQSAAYLRETDHYQNRTHELRNNTEAVEVQSGSDGETEIALRMNKEYAVYVVRRGFSSFYEVARETEGRWLTGLDSYMNDLVNG